MTPQPQKTPDQLGVKQRNLIIQVKDTMGVTTQEAILLLASLAALEKQHPEYGIQNLPPAQLIQAMKTIRQKVVDKHNVDETLNGRQNDAHRLGKFLG